MNTKKILSWIALLLGEAIIIAAFIRFRGDLTDDILILNIIVSSVIYALFFIDVLVPWVQTKDKSQRTIGSIGIRWVFTWLYAILAIAAMIICSMIFNFSLITQLLVHGSLIFLLLLGFISAYQASDKVHEVAVEENANRSGIVDMKKSMVSLKDKMNGLAGLPEPFTNRINTLEENIRFIAPSNNQEAYELERQFTQTIYEITFAVDNYSMNETALESNLKKCERLLYNRKQIYSN